MGFIIRKPPMVAETRRAHKFGRQLPRFGISRDQVEVDRHLVLMVARALRPSHSFLASWYASVFAHTSRRHLSLSIPSLNEGTVSELDAKTFSKTLLLPKTLFPLRNDPFKTEYRKKTCEDLYRWQVCIISAT
jgi:hypothetical protein